MAFTNPAYGPLTFSLKIKENYVNKPSDKSAIFDSKWQSDVDKDNWPTYEIYPGSAWTVSYTHLTLPTNREV